MIHLSTKDWLSDDDSDNNDNGDNGDNNDNEILMWDIVGNPRTFWATYDCLVIKAYCEPGQ